MVAAAEADGMELDIDTAMTDLALDIVGRTMQTSSRRRAEHPRCLLEAMLVRFRCPAGELLLESPAAAVNTGVSNTGPLTISDRTT